MLFAFEPHRTLYNITSHHISPYSIITISCHHIPRHTTSPRVHAKRSGLYRKCSWTTFREQKPWV